VLARHEPTRVTVAAIGWGVVAIAPLTAAEWWAGLRPVWTGAGIAGTVYLGVVITGFCYLLWNWSLARVAAPRAAIFLNVQPVVGALLGVMLLGDALTAFTLAGGALVVAGLSLTVKGRP
jgi:drug/metabolite transporter (DMT)-like permease